MNETWLHYYYYLPTPVCVVSFTFKVDDVKTHDQYLSYLMPSHGLTRKLTLKKIETQKEHEPLRFSTQEARRAGVRSPLSIKSITTTHQPMGLLFRGFVVRTPWASYDEPKKKCQSGFIQNDNRIVLRLALFSFVAAKWITYFFLCLGNLEVPSVAVSFHFFAE